MFPARNHTVIFPIRIFAYLHIFLYVYNIPTVPRTPSFARPVGHPDRRRGESAGFGRRVTFRKSDLSVCRSDASSVNVSLEILSVLSMFTLNSEEVSPLKRINGWPLSFGSRGGVCWVASMWPLKMLKSPKLSTPCPQSRSGYGILRLGQDCLPNGTTCCLTSGH